MKSKDLAKVPRSLFVISLPRSLSSKLYHACRHALGLNQPTWTTDGEILNADRFALLPQPNEDFGKKFTTENSESEAFRKLTEFLDHVFVRRGYAYKDVVQPFVVAAWIKKNKPPTIRIKRNVADVAYSMLQNHWHYPKSLFPNTKCLELAVIQGLLKAERALDSGPVEQIDFEDLIWNEEPLRRALNTLYGDILHSEIEYIDDEFQETRERIMKRRNTPLYVSILEHVGAARKSAD